MNPTEFKAELKRFIERYVPTQTIVGTVTAIDSSSPPKFCTVKPIKSPELFDVAFKSGTEDDDTGIIEVPEVDSLVLVGIKENQKRSNYIIKCSKVKEIIINGGSNGSLINWGMGLKPQLDNLSARVTTIVDAIRDSAVVAQDGGAAFKTNIIAAINLNLITEDFDDPKIEDPNVTH